MMDQDFYTLFRLASHGLNPEQLQRMEIAVNAAMLLGVLERLRGNSQFGGAAPRLQPIFAHKLEQLKALAARQPGAGSAEAMVAAGALEEAADLPDGE
jgi:hypothetical protein